MSANNLQQIIQNQINIHRSTGITGLSEKKKQLDVEVSPPANDLQMGNLQIRKSYKNGLHMLLRQLKLKQDGACLEECAQGYFSSYSTPVLQ